MVFLAQIFMATVTEQAMKQQKFAHYDDAMAWVVDFIETERNRFGEGSCGSDDEITFDDKGLMVKFEGYIAPMIATIHEEQI